MPEYKTFDDMFHEAWTNALSLENMLPVILKPKFEELGIHLTENQLAYIIKQVQHQDEEIDFGIDEEQLLNAGFTPDADGNFTLTIDLSDQAERLERLEEQLPDLIAEMVPKFTEEWGKELLESIDSTKSARLIEEQEYRMKFRSIVHEFWGEALDALEVFTNLVTEAGCDFAREYHVLDTEESDHKFEALIGLHARSCQIGKEILALLREGFADGAHARWRSLHEVTVIANFISDHDQDIAEKYLLHNVVEARKGAHQHKRYADRLNEPPPSDDEIRQLDEVCQSLRKRFGKSYLGTYGWAASALESQSPNFADIERKTGLDHLRPYYKLASHNVHANPTGILYRLGEDPASPTLVAGPSIFGLADPGHGAALSLLKVTTSLLIYQPTMDRNVRLQVLLTMTDQIGEAFYRAHWSLLDNKLESGSGEEE